MDSTFAVRPSLALAAAVLLGVAACSYTLGAAYGSTPMLQYSATTTQSVVRTHPITTGGPSNRHHLGQAAGPAPSTLLTGDTSSEPVASQPWLLPAASLGGVVVGAVLFAWTSARQIQARPSPNCSEWRAAALDLEEGFPGPGNPNDEFEVTVVWGGEERKLKINGDQSILMACEEAGLNVPFLCRHGVCLECTGQVLEGNEHARRDSQCHNDENVKSGYICTCSTYVGGNGLKV
eukprot:EG_transcript_26922